MPKISSKHQVTLPVESLARAGLKAGDEVTIEAEGPDTIVFGGVLRSARTPRAALGAHPARVGAELTALGTGRPGERRTGLAGPARCASSPAGVGPSSCVAVQLAGRSSPS